MNEAERYLAELLRRHPDLDPEIIADLEQAAKSLTSGYGRVRKVAADAGISEGDLKALDQVFAAKTSRDQAAIEQFTKSVVGTSGMAFGRVKKALAPAETLEQAIELAREQGVSEDLILQAQESIDLEDFDKTIGVEEVKAEAEAMLAKYRDAVKDEGGDSSVLSIEYNNDKTDFDIIYHNPATNALYVLNRDEVDIKDIGEPKTKDPLTGDLTSFDLPPRPDETPFFLERSYRINISVQEYFAMIRWLDPDVKERIKDREALQPLFTDTEFGINQEERGGLVKPSYLWRTFQQVDLDEVAVGPKYAAGDEVKLFWGRSPEYVASIQQLMVEANILDKGDIAKWGEWGLAEETAIVAQMVAADKRGLSIRQWLEARAKDPYPDPKPLGFTEPVEQLPDYAVLSQDLKAVFRNRLGREPEPYEMGDLIRQMEQDHYANYQEQVEGARLEWEARAKAAKTGEDQATGTIQNIDPFSRFRESFDKKYGPEIERNVEVAENRNNVAGMMNRLAGIERLVE